MLGIASDHAGFEMKEELKKFLQEKGYEVKDFGTHSPESMDYPDVAHPLAESVEKGEVSQGIALCGFRAALCWNEELAALARQHNDANVLSLPARFISVELAKRIVEKFLESSFEGGRHLRRVNKIPCGSPVQQ